MFNGVKLSSTKNTNFEEIESIDIDWNNIQITLSEVEMIISIQYTVICCPEILGVDKMITKFCSRCKDSIPDTTLLIYTCVNCERTLKLESLKGVVLGNMEISFGNEEIRNFGNILESYY